MIHLRATGDLRCKSGPLVGAGSLGTMVGGLEATVPTGQNDVLRPPACGSLCPLDLPHSGPSFL